MRRTKRVRKAVLSEKRGLTVTVFTDDEAFSNDLEASVVMEAVALVLGRPKAVQKHRLSHRPGGPAIH